jgi:hypothetical protein
LRRMTCSRAEGTTSLMTTMKDPGSALDTA